MDKPPHRDKVSSIEGVDACVFQADNKCCIYTKRVFLDNLIPMQSLEMLKLLTLPKASVKLFNIEISLYKRGNILMKYITDEENCTAANITARSL